MSGDQMVGGTLEGLIIAISVSDIQRKSKKNIQISWSFIIPTKGSKGEVNDHLVVVILM